MTYRSAGHVSADGTSTHQTRVPFQELVTPTSFVADGITVAVNQTWAVVQRAAARVAYRHRVNRTIRELSALDDRTLSDIGLQRGQIEAVARSAAERSGWTRTH